MVEAALTLVSRQEEGAQGAVISASLEKGPENLAGPEQGREEGECSDQETEGLSLCRRAEEVTGAPMVAWHLPMTW